MINLFFHFPAHRSARQQFCGKMTVNDSGVAMYQCPLNLRVSIQSKPAVFHLQKAYGLEGFIVA